jgi:hypothetical protein
MSVFIVGIALAPWAFALAFPALVGSEDLFVGVLLGVSIAGHARLSLECLQAFGATRFGALIAALFSVTLLGSVLVGGLHGSSSPVVVITAGWVAAGTVLALFADDRALTVLGAEPARRWAVGGRSALILLGTAFCAVITLGLQR